MEWEDDDDDDEEKKGKKEFCFACFQTCEAASKLERMRKGRFFSISRNYSLQT